MAAETSDPERNSTTPVAPARVPGPLAGIVVAVCLVLIVAVRWLGYAEDQPFPLDDPAIRNLVTLIGAFIAGATLWGWFTFASGYDLAARRAVFYLALLLTAAVGVVVASLGLTRSVQFSGSMAPRLAAREATLEPIQESAARESVDLTTTTPDDFPQFLGPQRSGWVPGPKLARDWTTKPPKLLWKRPIGAGWSAFAAVNGYAVTLEQRGAQEWIVCYEISTGKPVWGDSVKGRHENPLGGIGPRSTPTIHGGRVYALTATGVLRCLDGATGKLLWSDDLRKRYFLNALINSVVDTAAADESNVMWGRAGSPLVIDDMVVVPGGGPAGKAKNLVAFDINTGKLVWEAENKLDENTADQIAYASPSLARLAGRDQILIVNEKTASGHDPKTGVRLWSHPWPGNSNGDASSSQAVAIGENQVLLTKGYSGGAELIELVPHRSSQRWDFETETVWKVPRVLQTKFTNVVVYEGHIYGLSEGILECVEAATGKRKWKNGRYGHGQILGVGDLLLALSEEGELHLVEANPEKFVELSALQVLDGKTWNNLCLNGKRLLVRNAQEAACYELP